MKIVIAPDSFKESLPAATVAEAIAQGVIEVVPDARIDLCPVADGGEGTCEAMVAATAGEFRHADAFDPLGAPIRTKFGLLGQGGGAGLPGSVGFAAAVSLAEGAEPSDEDPPARTAVMDTAAASGLALVPPDKRDPTRTTSFGTGQLILAALDAGVRRIIVGVGGSATVDGGCGAAQALGVSFIDFEGTGCLCGLAGGGLAEVAGIDLTSRDPRLDEVEIIAACDVINPLLGKSGAARTYGPQKGATPEVVEQLEANLAGLAKLIGEELGINVSDMPGAGAAGGLAAGLVAFTGATLADGFELVAKTIGLARRLNGADVCITGEGSFDAQSGNGKAAAGVAKMAGIAGAAAICIPGRAAPDAPHELFAAVRPLVGGEISHEQAMANPAIYLKQRAAEAMRKFISQ